MTKLRILAAEMKRSNGSTGALIQLDIFKFLNNDSEMRNMLLIIPSHSMSWSERVTGGQESCYGTIPAQTFSFLLLLSSFFIFYSWL